MPLVMALVVLPTASRSVRIRAPSGLTSPDISAMPWALSETGPEGVHRDDDADRGEQAAAGQGHREQRDRDRPAEQERGVDGGGDDQGGEDSGFKAQGDPGQDHGRRTGQGGLADVLHGPLVGAGVVAGDGQDDRGQDDADDHSGRGDEARVARGVDTAGELGEVPGQVEEGGQGAGHGGDDGGDVEAPVDRRQAALAVARLGDVDPEHRGQHPDGRDDEREDQALAPRRRPCPG